MQHTTGVAVVATQFAGTDRRALSQAWYSALHLAERLPPARVAACAPTVSRGVRERVQRGGRANHAPQGSPTGGARGACDALRKAVARHVGEAPAAERRAPKTELPPGPERTPARRLPRGAPLPFAVQGRSRSVHVIVHSCAGRTRIVAACAPPLRERVERALAHARFALAGHGVRAEVA